MQSTCSLRGSEMRRNKTTNNISRAGKKEERTAYLCLIPAFLGVSLISYVPTLAVFVLSFFDWNGLTTPKFIGFGNFERIFTKDIYLAESIKATILYAFLAVVGAVLYSLIIALFRSSNEKNFLFLSLPTMATVQSPTAPSTAALSLGLRTLVGIIVVS